MAEQTTEIVGEATLSPHQTVASEAEFLGNNEDQDKRHIVHGLSLLVEMCGRRADDSGWHNDYPKEEEFAATPEGEEAFHRAISSWDAIKLALMASESIEGFEEIRNGQPVQLTYYDEKGKPEGVPSELADIVIRAFDYAWFRNVDIVGAIFEKLEYNAKRGQRHGGKGF